jgi:hypothetical protein
MTGLTTKSSTENSLSGSWGSASLLEQLVFHLADGFTKLARNRLTKKQQKLLLATREANRYRPMLSYTALADYLSRKLKMPFSTVKFNLRVLRKTGLLTTLATDKQSNAATLSHCGQLLVQLLPEQ